MADKGHQETDKELDTLERRIRSVYGEAHKDLQEKFDAFTSKFLAKDKEFQKQLKAGKITKEQYQAWRAGQVFQGKQWRSKLNQMTTTMTHADEVAQGIINGRLNGVFANNANWMSYTMEHGAGVNFGFELYDSSTVANLLQEQPELLPKYRMDIPEDQIWNQKLITRQITQGIIQGETIQQIGRRMEAVTNRDKNLSLTRARTAMTGAQNAGRQESLTRAQGMGIKVRKTWISTLDERTRTSHAMLDGVTIPLDQDFKGELGPIRFPGDPHAKPGERYNCRCTMAGDLVDYPDEYNAQRYDNIDGKPVADMSYKDWEKAKKAGQKLPERKEKPVAPEKPSGSWVEKAPAIPPKTEFYTSYDDYKAAVNEYIEKYGQDQYNQLRDAGDAHRSAWFFGFDEEKAARRDKALRFDNTITTLQGKYKLPEDRKLVIGDYENVKSYLTDVQRSRAAGDCAGQAWFNTESGNYVIGYNISYGKSFAEDLAIRSEKIKKGETLLSVFENDSPEGIAIHEYGHQMADYLTNGMIYDSPNSKAYWEWYKSLSKEDIKKGLSSYAATNRGEFEAECFAELQTDNPRPLALKYLEYLKKAIKEDYRVEL